MLIILICFLFNVIGALFCRYRLTHGHPLTRNLWEVPFMSSCASAVLIAMMGVFYYLVTHRP